MIINFNNTQIDLAVNDNSYRYRAIKGEHSLTLYYSLPQHVEIPIGATCVFEGETYTLEHPENFKKHNTRNFEYTLIMESAQAKLGKYKFKEIATRRLKFSFTAKPHEHLQMLVDNLNQREPGWTVGNCVDAVEKVISYNHAFCSDAFSQMMEAFETEGEIIGKTINLGKVEYNKNNPLPLSYGRGNGFKSGIGRSNTNNSNPVEILFVQGGTRNIDTSKYGSPELLLPRLQTIGYDGEYFSNQQGFNSGKARQYVTDSDGFSIRRSDKPLSSQAEDSLDCSHIYPSRVGTISAVDVVNEANHFYDIVDSSIPENLNFEDCLIEGETMTIIFQSGMLTGKEFDVKYIHGERRFEIAPQEIDGRTMPDDIFRPQVGQQYAVFGMMMPESYICDNATKTGASWDMFREAVKYMYENEEAKFTFTGELDGIWAKKDWLNIGGKIKLGGYVLFTDNQFQPDGVLIRIIGIKDFINNPHSPTIELSNEIVTSSIASDLRKIETNEVIVEDLHKDAVQFTKRRFRDSQETLKMLQDALLDGFGDSISPITVQTMAMLVGDESLQFRFVNNTTNPVSVPHTVTFNPETKILTSPAGIIQHMTIGIKTLTLQHAVSEYKFWNVSEFNSPPLTEPKKKYYLYAKVGKTNNTGTFRLSETAVKLEQEAGYYNLLVGILNSEFDGERSYVDLYGFTEVLPGRITTEKVVSSDGLNFLDFLNNAFRVGNNNTSLSFNTQGDGKLVLKGTLVQSQSGDTQPLGFFRGEYNNTYTYYEGDEVTYLGSTYRFIYPTPQTGKVPTNTTYWIVFAAKGEPGANGEASDWKTFAYKKSESKPNSPTDTTPIPSGWQDYPDSEATGNDKWWMAVAIVHWTGSAWVAGTFVNNTFVPGQWSEPIAVTGEQGTDGQYIDFKFCATPNLNAPIWNSSLANMLNPTGWADQPPTLPESGAIWMIEAWKQSGGTQLMTAWSEPVRISGEKGQDGQDGQNGNYTSFVFRLSDTQPATPTGTNPIPSGWADAPTGSGNSLSNITHGTTWSLQADGTRKSPAIDHNGFTKNRISFTTTQANQTIAINLKVSSESGYDFALVGLLDNSSLSISSNYTDRISGETERIITVNVPNAGSHFIEIGYGKDNSVSNRQDCAWYSISSGSIWWMSKATVSYQSGQWLAGAWSVPVKVTGEDGESGIDGKFWDYKYRVTSTQPATPTGLNPSGWTDAPPAVTSGNYLWMSYCEKTADQTAILWGWSTPVKISGENGQNGTNGQDGAFFEYRYQKYGSPDTPPSLSTTSDNPSGWTTTMPTLGSLEYLWMTVTKKKYDGTLLQNWSTPVRTNGEKGDTGAKGDAGPSIVFRGVYSYSSIYYGTENRVDVVKHNGNYYVTRVDAGEIFPGQAPISTWYWNEFGAQFDSVATNLLLAEMANIAGWVFRNERLESQSGGAFLDGRTGEVAITGKFSSSNNGERVEIYPTGNSRMIFKDDNRTRGEFRFGTDIDGTSLLDLILTTYRNGTTVYSYYGSSRMTLFGVNGSLGVDINLLGNSLSVMFRGLPTSSSGLPSGSLWRNGNILNIVP